MIGSSLGPYKLLEQLGAGGMGEVYLGEDTRLGRKVAIKVLPAEFAGDPERLARFEQEARAAAALNHPHIAAVFDVGAEGDTHFMVQEYLEGHTLGTHLSKGALPLKRAFGVAIEVAKGLTAAHGAGIVHRDLKPDNVFLTDDGHVKILDFGLAKLVQVEALPARDAATSPTMVGTMAGQVMGTAGYMAPEQVEAGAEIDHRADVFAFGCLLYEAVSGNQPFASDSVLDTLHKIVHSEPRPLAQLDRQLPAELQRILKKCLAKDPADRYQLTDDLVVDLRTLAVDVDTGAAQPIGLPAAAPWSSRWGRPVPWTLAALVAVVALIAGTVVGSLRRPAAPPQPVTSMVIDLPPTDELGRGRSSGQLIAFSPNGRYLAYGVGSGSEAQLYLRHLAEFEAKPIEGTDGAYNAFFSPDSEWLGFFSEGGLKKVSLAGGQPTTLCASCGSGGATWGPDNNIVFGQNGSLWVVPDSGGPPELLAEPNLDKGETDYRRPEFLPGGRAVLFELRHGEDPEVRSVAVLPLEGGEPRIVAQEGADPLYVPTGHIVYQHVGMLFAEPFDVDRLEAPAEPTQILDGVLIRSNGTTDFSVANDGTAVYVPGTAELPSSDRSLVWVTREGEAEPLTPIQRTFIDARVSPNGERIAVSISEEGTRNVWIFEDGTLDVLTSEGDNRVPVWTPDGEWVTFSSNRDGGTYDLYRRRSDFSGTAEPLLESENSIYPVSWSPLSRELAFYERDPETGRDIFALPFYGDGEPVAFLDTSANERAPMVSPDGRWLAYVSDRLGQNDVYVRPFPEPGGRRWRVSTDGGREPLWSPDGRELFYRSGESGERMMVAELTFEPSFDIGERRQLFEGRYVSNRHRPVYDIDPDGQRFLFIRREGEPEPRQRINVVFDWFEELKQRVSMGR